MSENIKEIIAKNLVFYRKKNRMTQKQLAELLGVKHNAISSWENSINCIDVDTLFKVCQIFKITVNDMYDIQETPSINIFRFNEDEFTKEQLDRIKAFAKFIKQEDN